MELISLAGTDRTRLAQNAGEDSSRIAQASNSLQNTSVRKPKHRVRRLQVVSDAQARFHLAVRAETAINISAQAEINGEVACRDCILDVQRHLLDVGVTAKCKKRSAARQIERQQSGTRVGQSRYACKAFIPIRVCQRRNERRIHDSQAVLLR